MDSVAKSFTPDQIRILKIVMGLSLSPPKIFTFDESWNTPSTPSTPILSSTPSSPSFSD
tara:strand:+ start:653 stop:829 length:177 start_codon:yes stop_codon:yes gene_type:complete